MKTKLLRKIRKRYEVEYINPIWRNACWNRLRVFDHVDKVILEMKDIETFIKYVIPSWQLESTYCFYYKRDKRSNRLEYYKALKRKNETK